MVDRSQGRKISNFLAETSLVSTDILNIVKEGTNFKVSFSDLVASLGALGTIEQEGAVTGTAVLDIVGTINKIRNLENGSGVKSSVSAENGITLNHNFALDTVGFPLSNNFTATQPIFNSLESGPGIGLSIIGNRIVISESSVATGTKTVIITQLSDLPTPVSSVITLLADTEYFFINDVNLGTNRLVLNNKTTIKGTDSVIITLTYTGTGTLFSTTTATNRISLLTISCTSGTMLSVTAPTGAIFRMTDCSYNCDVFGTFTGGVFPAGGVARFTNVSGVVATNGLTFTGNWRSILFDTSASTVTSAGAFFNLGTATFDAFYAQTFLISLAAGTFFIDGATGSANVNAGGVGSVLQNRFSGAGTPITGVTVDDALWDFNGNDDIADTRPDGLLSMQGNATNTVIAVAGTAVLVAGTWVIEDTSQVTGTTAGRLTYDGGKNAKLPMTASVTIVPVSGGSVEIGAMIALNGTTIPNSLRTSSTSAGNPTSITVPWQLSLSTGDFIEVFVSNEDSTVDLLVSSAVFRLD